MKNLVVYNAGWSFVPQTWIQAINSSDFLSQISNNTRYTLWQSFSYRVSSSIYIYIGRALFNLFFPRLEKRCSLEKTQDSLMTRKKRFLIHSQPSQRTSRTLPNFLAECFQTQTAFRVNWIGVGGGGFLLLSLSNRNKWMFGHLAWGTVNGEWDGKEGRLLDRRLGATRAYFKLFLYQPLMTRTLVLCQLDN